MNPARFESAQRGLSVMAKKVYDATPISEPWTAAQIFAEQRRLGGGGGEVRVTQGCLNSLIEAGLVVERPRGVFCRIHVREKQPKEPQLRAVVNNPPETEMPSKTNKQTAPTEQVGAIDQLTCLSARVRRLMTELQTLASDIDTAALSIAEQGEHMRADQQKYQQLQALLKGVG